MLELAPTDQTPDPALLAFVNGDSERLPETIVETWIAGTPVQVEARIRDYIAEGIDHFMLWFVDAPRDDGLTLFAEQVLPRFR
jgi:alkanesulfonate monooxygenase SsuD/methylene tetrahydromethanopterin reductase-like flavin-dependent oxidoreductase (luciferase family)